MTTIDRAPADLDPGEVLDIRKITANIGAEVAGLDISRPLDARTVAALRAGLNEHKALVFRGVDLDNKAQERFAGYFGPLTSAHPTVPSVADAPNVLPVDSEGSIANHWHTDVTFVVNPPQLSTLRSVVVPPYGGETQIANQAAAYRNLPEPLRQLADSLWAVHSNANDYARVASDVSQKERDRYSQFTAIEFQTVHPVVRVHPLTGERGLFIGGFVRQIKGLSTDESTDVVRMLQAYVIRPENVLRWRWSPNELLIFDNRITQHCAIDNFDHLPRQLRRVTVAGDIPAGINGDRSYSVKGDSSHYSEVLELAA